MTAENSTPWTTGCDGGSGYDGRTAEALALLLPLTASAESRIGHLARMFGVIRAWRAGP